MQHPKNLLDLDIDMFNVSQVAQIKKVSVNAIREAIRKCILPATKVGSVWIIMRKDINKYYPNASKKYRRKRIKFKKEIIL